MKLKSENKIIMKQWAEVFIILGILVVLAFSIWAIITSVAPKEKKEDALYTYNYNSNLNYRVYLKQNQFFTSNFLGMNKQYISSIVDNIELDIKYDFQTSEDIEYSYSYEVSSTIKGNYTDAESKTVEVWSKRYPILTLKSNKGTGKTFTINETIKIDYNTYNEVMNNFKNAFGLSIDAVADIDFKINISGNLVGQENTLQENQTMTLHIPLLKPTFEMVPEYNNSGGNAIYKPKTSEEDININIPLLLIGIILLGGALYLIKKFVAKLLATTKKSEYVLYLNKILKEYGDLIAKADNVPNISQYEIINIKEFKDLADISEEIHSPIIFNEIVENAESTFMIFHDKTAYKFTLKYSNFEHFKK